MSRPLSLALLCVSVLVTGSANAQTFDVWLQGQIHTAVGRMRIGISGKSTSRQHESPSADDRSTSLVDQSSSSEFVSVAMSLIPIGTFRPAGTSSNGSAAGAGTTGSGSSTVTASGYSLLAALSKKSMTDPAFYAAHTDARRIAFTVGTAASTKDTDNTDKPGAVGGFKYLVINERDLYSKAGREAVEDVQMALTRAASNYSPLADKIQRVIYLACQPDGNCRAAKEDILGKVDPEAFGRFVLRFNNNMAAIRFTPEVLNQIEDLIQAALSPFREFQDIVERSYDRIHQGRQLAFSYQVVKRVDNGNDDHRAELIYDHGLTDSITWTVNVSGDYRDRKTARDSRGGRVATEFKGRLTRESDAPFGRTAMNIAFSGEGKWLTKTKPQYTFQAKLTIPVASGIDLPIVYRWAGRRDMIDQTASEARLGFSIDTTRLAQLFR